MEAIGDITASAEVSRVEVEGLEFDSRIQGGVFGDGVGGLLSGLMTNPPLSIFAQNNGVVSKSIRLRVTSSFVIPDCHHSLRKSSGRVVVLRVFGLVRYCRKDIWSLPLEYVLCPRTSSSSYRLTCGIVPNPVLGGVTTFLFATVMTSGIRVLSYITWSRRNRFTLAAAMSFGVGNLLAPGWYAHLFEGVQNPSPGLQGFFDSITIILGTPCTSQTSFHSGFTDAAF
jgi:xanthine/uracil permease